MPTLDRRLLIAVAATAMLASGLASAAPAKTAADKAYASVDPFIGTGGEGHTYPGATVPFGMVQLSPDTRIQPREKAYGWAAGYRYDDSSIVGFSHTHFSGTGHSDLGDILLMPFTGTPGLERGDPEKPRSGYASRFRHDDEKAEPGYYAVTLDDYQVRAELTTSARVGVHRYAFPKGADAKVLLDMRTSMYDYPGKVLWSRVRVRADGTVTGTRILDTRTCDCCQTASAMTATTPRRSSGAPGGRGSSRAVCAGSTGWPTCRISRRRPARLARQTSPTPRRSASPRRSARHCRCRAGIGAHHHPGLRGFGRRGGCRGQDRRLPQLARPDEG